MAWKNHDSQDSYCTVPMLAAVLKSKGMPRCHDLSPGRKILQMNKARKLKKILKKVLFALKSRRFWVELFSTAGKRRQSVLPTRSLVATKSKVKAFVKATSALVGWHTFGAACARFEEQSNFSDIDILSCETNWGHVEQSCWKQSSTGLQRFFQQPSYRLTGPLVSTNETAKF